MKFEQFIDAIQWATRYLIDTGQDVNPGRWQGVSTEGKPDLVTKEVMNLCLDVPVHRPAHIREQLQHEIRPNLPWADDHFAERVGRKPTNPGEEYKNWPWWHGQTHLTAASHIDPEHPEFAPANFRFDHTYQERFWPKKANREYADPWRPSYNARGIRYEYGDLDDVVSLLFKEPLTRQATFPIFFPEDTGSVHGGRVPCTLHYHFLMRNNQLHMWYPIRSCDLVRHFRDDLYMACRLMLWVIDELREKELRDDNPQVWWDVIPGMLHFTAYSFHVHYGDLHHVKTR